MTNRATLSKMLIIAGYSKEQYQRLQRAIANSCVVDKAKAVVSIAPDCPTIASCTECKQCGHRPSCCKDVASSRECGKVLKHSGQATAVIERSPLWIGSPGIQIGAAARLD